MAADHLRDKFNNLISEVAEFEATTIAGLKFKACWAEQDEEITELLIRDLIELKI